MGPKCPDDVTLQHMCTSGLVGRYRCWICYFIMKKGELLSSVVYRPWYLSQHFTRYSLASVLYRISSGKNSAVLKFLLEYF